jgi:hypothetical protein
MIRRDRSTLAGRATRRLLRPIQKGAAARPMAPSAGSPIALPTRGLTDKIVWRPVAELKAFGNNPRKHPEAQIAVGAAAVSSGTHRRKNHGGREAAAAPRGR